MPRQIHVGTKLSEFLFVMDDAHISSLGLFLTHVVMGYDYFGNV